MNYVRRLLSTKMFPSNKYKYEWHKTRINAFLCGYFDIHGSFICMQHVLEYNFSACSFFIPLLLWNYVYIFFLLLWLLLYFLFFFSFILFFAVVRALSMSCCCSCCFDCHSQINVIKENCARYIRRLKINKFY